VEIDEPLGARRLDVGEDFLHRSLYARPLNPQFGPAFPARQLKTGFRWDELVLDPYTFEQLEELKAWLQHGETLMKAWQLERKMMPGYRCLFHGPPGTGKSLTAALLGQVSERKVYCIDLSLIISKYIGETEKNLEKVFVQAEKKNWLLFFDEADALFGKRTQVNDSHDRFANQETSYLLQRVEIFPGVVILATNLKTNIDDAFSRRFQSVIHFPIPDKTLRYQLWQQSFSPITKLAEDIDLKEIAARFEMAGGAIMNVVRYCSLMALKRHSTEIMYEDLEQGILREFNKEGRSAD
jgi:SpoVK/Ycf46/Vps4 family AAA+-type ATPase